MSKLDDILIYLAKNDDLLHYSKDGANPEAKQQIKALFLELTQTIADKYTYQAKLSLEQKAKLCNISRKEIEKL